MVPGNPDSQAHFVNYNGETFIVQTTTSTAAAPTTLTLENATLECITEQPQIPPPPPAKRKRVKVASASSGSRAVEKKSGDEREADKETKRSKFIEMVSAYKCKLCNMLGHTVGDIETHLASNHEVEYFDEEDWLEVAQKEDIRLECPRCENNFSSEGSRSFKVHMVDDHHLSEEVADSLFEEQNGYRKAKAMALLRDQKLSMKIRRSALLNVKMEAYIDERGELRVKSIQEECDTEEFDVSAEKYFNTVRNGDELSPSSMQVTVAVDPRRAEEISSSPGSKSNLGRKKGSKTIGLSKLKQINPNISMSEEVLGTPCDRGRCGVRLVDPEKLKYHRELCHDAQTNEFICPECQKESVKFTGLWSKVAMHLWREHKVDMELLACDKCPQFRAFNRTRFDDHMTKHKTDRPYQCDECDKAFKQERHLKDHVVRGHGKRRQYESNDQITKYSCSECQRVFKAQNALVNHVKTVHEGLRPFCCRFCDYAASNKSNLNIHERQHTGEKPYFCDFCEYRAADRSSLKKHLLRHSGVKKFFCKLCQFGTIQSVNLAYHYNTSHCAEAIQLGYLFKCNICKYYTIGQDRFRAHMDKRHQGDEDDGDDKDNDV